MAITTYSSDRHTRLNQELNSESIPNQSDGATKQRVLLRTLHFVTQV